MPSRSDSQVLSDIVFMHVPTSPFCILFFTVLLFRRDFDLHTIVRMDCGNLWKLPLRCECFVYGLCPEIL